MGPVKNEPRTLVHKTLLAPVSHGDPVGDGLVLRGHWELVPKPLFSPQVALEPLAALSLGLPQWW